MAPKNDWIDELDFEEVLELEIAKPQEDGFILLNGRKIPLKEATHDEIRKWWTSLFQKSYQQKFSIDYLNKIETPKGFFDYITETYLCLVWPDKEYHN